MDRFMRNAGYDHRRIIQPSAAVRFQAGKSNELWQFDMSPSDLKQVPAPLCVAACNHRGVGPQSSRFLAQIK